MSRSGCAGGGEEGGPHGPRTSLRGSLKALARSPHWEATAGLQAQGERRGRRFGEGEDDGITVQCARLRAQVSRHIVVASIIVGAASMSACASSGGNTRRPVRLVAQQRGHENNSWDRVTVYISRGDRCGSSVTRRRAREDRVPDSASGLHRRRTSTYHVAIRSPDSRLVEQFMFPSAGLWSDIENQSDCRT